MEKNKCIISFSGGRTSAYMTYLLLTKEKNTYDYVVVFANTGKEREETLEFVNNCDKYFGFNTVWVEAVTNNEFGVGTSYKVVNYETASRSGEPFEGMIKKYGLPNVSFPHCTRELKTNTIRSYAKSLGWNGYYTAIGIRVDEIDRVSPDHEKKKYIYPLVTYQYSTDKKTVNEFWKNQSFDLKLKPYQGNCDLCFKKSYKKLAKMVSDDNGVIDWWRDMETKYENYIPVTRKNSKPPIRIFRNNKNTDYIIKLSKLTESQLSLFTELEISNGCTESCEVF